VSVSTKPGQLQFCTEAFHVGIRIIVDDRIKRHMKSVGDQFAKIN